MAAILLTGGIALATGYYYLLAPQFHPDHTTYIYVDRDDTADSVYHKVQRYGRARSLAGFRWMMRYKDYDRHVHTGRYAIRRGENVYHVFSRLLRGYQEPMNLTIGSVRTLGQLARHVGRQLMADSAEIAATLNDSTWWKPLGYNRATLPSLFIPNTYQVYWNMTPIAFVKRMQQEHERFWTRERLDKATSIGMTTSEVSTLASIVEEETNSQAEKPIVAGLYINRLKAGIPLQADPTVKFALQDFGLRRITNAHLKTASPYNTYLHAGLPPGPIRIPSPAGIDAVLNYTRHNYLYMCAKEDFSGTHNFASNLSDHMRNARKYWNALNRRKIYR